VNVATFDVMLNAVIVETDPADGLFHVSLGGELSTLELPMTPSIRQELCALIVAEIM
jgi:hypothetical protein